ncbi:hypothetical protein K435DRAFT_880606 [Dendrothele bispora CBS 962.96]|uniref:Uncharacterized protein n=1 Tax=Dendrothele bispora (strain CBS 962.96) TaxID=1314807 RepID=A0A4S8KJE3_DENBC|nr:hypothetical protein K435DRAFT_880606 [Dendrothele bispora CBS 962.96]
MSLVVCALFSITELSSSFSQVIIGISAQLTAVFFLSTILFVARSQLFTKDMLNKLQDQQILGAMEN